MLRAALGIALVTMATSAAAIEVTCANGITWAGGSVEDCPCCEVCADGSWVVTGVDRCPDLPRGAAAPAEEIVDIRETPRGRVTVRQRVDPPSDKSEPVRQPQKEYPVWDLISGPLTFATIAAAFIVGGALVFLPALIAWRRRHHQLMPITALTVFNVFVTMTVWVFPVSLGAVPLLWFVALVWSLTAVKSTDKRGRIR